VLDFSHEGSIPRFKASGGREKAERQLNALLRLKRSGYTPVPLAQLVRFPHYGEMGEAVERKVTRDKNELRDMGLHIKWLNHDHHAGAGYVFDRADPPPFPQGKVRRAFERFIHILHAVEMGYEPTVDALAAYLGVKPEWILEDLGSISCCGEGDLPHQMLDVEVVHGVVKIHGPHIWKKGNHA